MRAWIVAAAVAASLRSVYLCVSLFPLPAGAWLTAVVQVAVRERSGSPCSPRLALAAGCSDFD